MRPVSDLRDAALGWVDLAGNRPGGERFNASRAGLVIMLGWYGALVLVTLVIQSAARYGVLPHYGDAFVSIVLNALPMLAILLVTWLTARFLQPAVGMFSLLVPAGYALVFILAIGLPLSLLRSGMFSAALQGILGYLLYRLGRNVGKFSIGVSIGFAVLNVLLLVAIPIGLYMLFVPELPTPD